MNYRVIARNVGLALLVSALFMFLSIVVSMLHGNDGAFAPLTISFLITFIVGAFPFIFVRKPGRISLTEGYLIIVLSWLLSFVFGMLPYALYGEPFSIENAWFESVSGFTTTGATILEDIELLPDSLLFWRSSTHFIGGLGVVVFLLLIIPDSSPIRLKLTNMEVSSLSRDTYSTKAGKSVWIFAYVYIGIFVAALISYILAGMSIFDALNHAMSVCATGGFSNRNLSIGAFDSTAINLITIFFMLIASIHFGLIFIAFATRSLKPFKNPILRFYILSLVIFSVITSISLKMEGACQSWGQAFMNGSFHIVSYASTTGFAISDNSHWGMLPSTILLLSSIFCGCAGSTTGGIKIDRLLVMYKAIINKIQDIVHPNSVNEIRIGRHILHFDNVYPHILYLTLYFLVLSLSIVASLIFAPDSRDAISGAISTLSTVGPSIGDSIGSLGNFNHEPIALKIIFSLNMFLGRIEIYPLLAVLSMLLSRHKK
ncbi:MAG: TrkH family potassium uptake protein [Bacteroidales bacterium]|nr:TrkH family potassium uptake protein [Bacteroidales bacterium]